MNHNKTDTLPLIQDGVLTICTINDFQPMIFQNQDGIWDGYEVEILTAITQRMNLKLNFVVKSFDGIWLLPNLKICDLAAAGLTILTSRIDQGAQFTQPILILEQSLLIRTIDQNYIVNIQDLSGKKIGIIPGTTGETNARKQAPEDAIFQEFADEKAMLNALQLGQIDAIARGTPGNSYQVQINQAFTITGIMPTDEKVGFAVAPDNHVLLNKINAEILGLKSSGELNQIYQKWFRNLVLPNELIVS